MSAVADRVSFDETSFTVHLADGGALQVPLDCFSKLLGQVLSNFAMFAFLRLARGCVGSNSTKTLVSANCCIILSVVIAPRC